IQDFIFESYTRKRHFFVMEKLKGILLVLYAVALSNASVIKENTNKATKGVNFESGKATEICARIGSDGILVAHEHCTRFYKCAEGRPVALKCPPNLLYNPSNEQCDWPHNVECGDRTIPEDDDDVDSESDNGSGGNGNENDNTGNGHADPSLATEICAEKDSDGVLVAHEHCTRFYKCFDSHPVALICPPNLLYNPNNEQCDWPHNVECGDRTIPEDDEDIDSESDNGNGGNGNENDNTGNGHADPSLATEICAENDSDGVLVAHEHCTRFYKCFNSRPVALVCPPNLLYNPSNEQCDWPHNVECGDRTIPEDDEDIDSESDNGNGGNGNENENTGNGHADPSLATEICAEKDSDGVLVAHEHCTRFYKCFDSHPVALICPPNLLYNPNNEQCDWPHNVECGDRTIPEDDEDVDSESDNGNGGNGNENENTGNGHADPSLATEICAENDSDGVLVAHEHCTRFYKCFNSRPVALICPPNLLYNPSNEQCDWPHNVECGDRTIPESDEDEDNNDASDGNLDGNDNEGNDNSSGNCDPSAAPTLCAQTGSDSVLIAHENCDKFYICWNHKPVVLSCPPNLLYNPSKEECDWPQNVDCGSRIIP
ncbi:chondroitin proteoglycan-2-like, partial [Bombyx mandarina]|uniref:Chondroitin proteoglycan-2-like n=1 Tax=Bombyx mandarina TaxID=7092 RepID=A0A6J2KTZ1_BOMMA